MNESNTDVTKPEAAATPTEASNKTDATKPDAAATPTEASNKTEATKPEAAATPTEAFKKTSVTKPQTAVPPTGASKKTDPKKPQKRTPSLWVRALRWLLLILIIFGLGTLTVVFLLYIPTRQELDSARNRISGLQNQTDINMLSANQEIDRLSSLASESEDLQSDLGQAQLHILLLKAQLDVTRAQLALAEKDPSKARLALSKTSRTLQEITKFLPEDQRKVIEDMQTRLNLILDELKDDDYAAQSDLDVLLNSLLELESALIR